MTILYCRAVDAVVPAPSVIDVNDVADTPGPYYVGFQYWIETADPLAGGAFQIDIEYEDPTGALRVISGAGISFAIAGSLYTRPVEIIQRMSGSSIWRANVQVLGSAGSALVSYRISHSAAASTDIQLW